MAHSTDANALGPREWGTGSNPDLGFEERSGSSA